MPRASASRGPGERQPPPSPRELAAVGRDDAGQDLEERRLAGAVLADERVASPAATAEADAAQRADGAERLPDVVELEPWHASMLPDRRDAREARHADHWRLPAPKPRCSQPSSNSLMRPPVRG